MSANAEKMLCKTPWAAWALLGGWLLAALALLWQQSQPYYGVFDPDHQLLQLPAQRPVLLASQFAATPDEQLLAVLDEQCYCSLGARRHLAELSRQSQRQIPIWSVAQLQAAGLQLPATPALLWWRQGRLWYVGPLSGGIACSSNDDLLLPLLTGQQQLADTWLNSETTACRCPA